MKIHKTFLLFALGIAVLVMGALQVIFRVTFLRSFEKIENQQLAQDMVRINDLLANQINSLNDVTKSWSFWNEAYTFAQEGSDSFVETQMSDEGVIAADINIVAFLNQQGNVIGITSLDLEKETTIDLPHTFKNLIEENPQVFLFSNPNEYKSGILVDNNVMILVSAYPILTSSAEGPVMGTTIMARYLTDEKIHQLQQNSRYDFSLMPVTSLPVLATQLNQLQHDQIMQVVAGQDAIVSYETIPDFLGNKTIGLELKKNRETYNQGLVTFSNFTNLMLVVVVVIILIIILIIQVFLTRPLTKIEKELQTITETQDFKRRLPVKQVADFISLVTNVNHMLETNERLGQSTRDGAEKLKQKLEEIRQKNAELEQTKLAMMNILEDERELEEQLKLEKTGIEEKVVERTKDLEVEQAKLKGSIENLPVGFMMVDGHGEAAMSNKAIKQIFKDQSTEATLILVKTWVKNQEGVILDEASGLPTSLHDFGTLPYESKYVDISIAPMTTTTTALPVVRIGWVILVNDVTEEKMVQKTRDEFFSIASHELRTPLTAIRGNTALIRDYYPQVMQDESLAPLITDIHTASLRLIQIVNDFLDASRLELNKLQFKLEPFDITEMAKKVVETEKVLAAEKQIDCSLIVENNQPYMVTADQARVEQILYNLIGNAVKFTKIGGVTVEVKPGENNTVKVRVVDSGAGIPKENHGLLFKKFQQAGESLFTREASMGSGMGLYISSLLAQGMHSTVRLESSELGKGSVFVLELPIG